MPYISWTLFQCLTTLMFTSKESPDLSSLHFHYVIIESSKIRLCFLFFKLNKLHSFVLSLHTMCSCPLITLVALQHNQVF